MKESWEESGDEAPTAGAAVADATPAADSDAASGDENDWEKVLEEGSLDTVLPAAVKRLGLHDGGCTCGVAVGRFGRWWRPCPPQCARV